MRLVFQGQNHTIIVTSYGNSACMVLKACSLGVPQPIRSRFINVDARFVCLSDLYHLLHPDHHVQGEREQQLPLCLHRSQLEQ